MAYKKATGKFKKGKKFTKGAPQRTFTRKDGKTFTNTFSSDYMARKASTAWVENGGKKPKNGRFSGKRK